MEKKLFNELAYSHDDAYSWEYFINNIDEFNALIDLPSNKKKFHHPYWKNKLLYIIKTSNYLDYKKLYEKIITNRSLLYDFEIDDYSECAMFSEESSDSSDDSNDDSNDESDKISKKSSKKSSKKPSKKPQIVKLTKKDIKKITEKTGANIH